MAAKTTSVCPKKFLTKIKAETKCYKNKKIHMKANISNRLSGNTILKVENIKNYSFIKRKFIVLIPFFFANLATLPEGSKPI